MTLLRLTPPVIVFGRYRLSQDPLRLTVDGVPVVVGARALALLSALVHADGQPVPFAELANRIWGRPNVEINSVRVQVSALRRALAEDRDLIATMAGYGYRFVGRAERLEARSMAPASCEPVSAYPFSAALDIAQSPAARTPLPLTPFIGRYAELSELLGLMSMARVITLVGAPGLGKTRLAHEVARRVGTHFPDGIGSVTLSPQMPPDSLIRTLAQAARIEPAKGLQTPEQFAAAIGARRLLLIVDCCDPLRAPLGALIDKLIAIAPGLRVLVIGTEPMMIAQEQVVAVGPLRTPGHIDIRVEEALGFDAFRLLFTRLTVLLDAHQRKVRQQTLTDANLLETFDLGRLAPDAVSTAALITRRLNGVPLALELAAAAIARRMSNRVPLEVALLAFANKLGELMVRGAGRADMSLSCKAAIAAVLELHNDEFDDQTRTQLRWLGVFSGEFTRRAAIDMLTQFSSSRDDSDSDKAQIDARCEAGLDDLLGAGLIEQVEGVRTALLRLPGSVRLFAIDALGQANEFGRAAAAHARSLVARLSANVARGVRLTGDGAAHIEINELRAALKWSVFNDRFETAIALIEASAPLWRQLSLMHEYLRMIRIVLTRVSASAPRRTREEMRLCKALADALPLTQASRQEATSVWREVYELANACGDNVYRQHALAGLIDGLPETWEMNRSGGVRAPYEGISQPHLKARCQVEA